MHQQRLIELKERLTMALVAWLGGHITQEHYMHILDSIKADLEKIEGELGGGPTDGLH